MLTARQLMQTLLTLEDLDTPIVFVNQKTHEVTSFVDAEIVETNNDDSTEKYINLIKYDSSL